MQSNWPVAGNCVTEWDGRYSSRDVDLEEAIKRQWVSVISIVEPSHLRMERREKEMGGEILVSGPGEWVCRRAIQIDGVERTRVSTPDVQQLPPQEEMSMCVSCFNKRISQLLSLPARILWFLPDPFFRLSIQTLLMCSRKEFCPSCIILSFECHGEALSAASRSWNLLEPLLR